MTDHKHVRGWCKANVNEMQKLNWNKVALPSNCTVATWDTTYAVCKAALSRGFTFACEVKMINGRRADVIIPEMNLVVEIFDSEKQASINSKAVDYGPLMVAVPAVPTVAVNTVFGA